MAKKANKKPVKKDCKKPVGRPSVFSEQIAVSVLEGIMGGDDLMSICVPEKMPCKRTWLRWVAEDLKLQDRYVAAMQIRTLNRAEECIPIADKADTNSKAGVQKARLQINSRQWEIQRLMPKVYGKDGLVDRPGREEEQRPILKLCDLRAPGGSDADGQ